MDEPGDRETRFLRLYNAAQPVLRGYLMAWLRDFHRADDILPETSLLLWKQFAEYHEGESFTRWALGIARNIALKALRNARTPPRLACPEVLEAIARTYSGSAYELEQRRRALQVCLERLSPRLREVVDLHYGHSLQLADVARRLRRSARGIAVSLFRARQRLAECTRKVPDLEVV